MRKELPKISVIMAVYNSESTVDEAITSILNQTYSNFEFIICDDCSTDSTYEKLKFYKENYPEKIILIKNEKNSKLPFSLNHCLKYATGEYIARMDADDFSLPTRFEKQINFLIENEDVMVVGCNMQRFDGEQYYGIVATSPFPKAKVLRNSVPFCHATIMMRKTVYDQLEGYTVSKRTVRGQDRDLWFRFYSKGFKGANLQEVLYMVREDIHAVKRRTIKVRWYDMLTSLIGYKLLKFPLRDYPYAFIPLFKALVPTKLILLYSKGKI